MNLADLAPIFILLGALPAVVYPAIGYNLWKRRVLLEEEQWRRAERGGYAYLALFAVIGIWFTGLPAFAGTDRVFIALGWIATPALAGVLGIVVFADRQRLALDRWPTVLKMRERTTENRDSVRSATVNLSNDLNRALTGLDHARQSVAGEWWDSERSRIESVVERLRVLLKQARALEEKYTFHLARLTDALRDEGFSKQPLSDDHEARLERLQRQQREIDRDLGRLLDGAVVTRAELNRAAAGRRLGEAF